MSVFSYGLEYSITPDNTAVLCSVGSCTNQHIIVPETVDESVSEKYDLPVYLTPDRTASLIAAKHLFKNKGCTVFDRGAMLTVDFIDKDGKYQGGNFSLGCRTRFKSLHRYSKNLPLLQCQEDVPEIGKDVFSSIHSGVISGMGFELTGYLSQNHRGITSTEMAGGSCRKID